MSVSSAHSNQVPECYSAVSTMQNGTYSWVTPPSLSQKSWPPGYQASLTNLFLKKNPLHFGTGISQLAAASSYLEKMSNLNDSMQKCPHPDAKDKPYPCEICQKYLTLCNSLRTDANSSSSTTTGGTARTVVSPQERKPSSLPMLPPPPPMPQNACNQHLSQMDRTLQHGQGSTATTHRSRPPPTKQFMCPVCHKFFTQKGNLKTHMMIHTGEKPYSCQVCGKSFTQKGNVDTHMKIHTGEKDFACETCGKRFTQKGNLKTHVRSVHTKEKPFACGVCGKCFSQKGNMQTHMRTHNKDDRFPCTLCGKTFSQKGNLKTHMQRHTGQLPPRRYGSRGSRAANAITNSIGAQARLALQSSSHLPTFPLQPSSSQPSPTSGLHSANNQSSNKMGQNMISVMSNKSMSDAQACKIVGSPLPQISPLPLSTSHLSLSHKASPPTSAASTHHHVSSPSPDHTGMPHNLAHHDHQPMSPMSREALNHPQLNTPSPQNSQHLRLSHPPPCSSSDISATCDPESRPFYSAPPTPVPSSIPHSPRWLVHGHPRHYDNFQSPPPLSSYPSLHQHPTPLSRLSLLSSSCGSPHAPLGSPCSEEKQQQQQQQQQQTMSQQSQQHMNESHFHSPTNPDFSQLLE